MKDTLKKLRKDQVSFVSALLDCAAKQKTWPPEFCSQDIIKILDITETELNIMKYNAGDCCIYIGSDRYRINVNKCLLLREQLEQRKLIPLNWLLIIFTLFILVISFITLIFMFYPPKHNFIPKIKNHECGINSKTNSEYQNTYTKRNNPGGNGNMNVNVLIR